MLPLRSDACERCAQPLQRDMVLRLWCWRCGYRATRRPNTHGPDNPLQEDAKECLKCGSEISVQEAPVLRCALCGISAQRADQANQVDRVEPAALADSSLVVACFRTVYAGLGAQRADALRCTVVPQIFLVQLLDDLGERPLTVGVYVAPSSSEVLAALADRGDVLRALDVPRGSTLDQRQTLLRSAIRAGDGKCDRLRIVAVEPSVL